MQIVIEINEKDYNEALRGCFNITEFGKAVRFHSTPLPEHHGDLKDVNKIKEEAVDMSQWGSETAYGVWVEDIDAAPVIIPATERR